MSTKRKVFVRKAAHLLWQKLEVSLAPNICSDKECKSFVIKKVLLNEESNDVISCFDDSLMEGTSRRAHNVHNIALSVSCWSKTWYPHFRGLILALLSARYHHHTSFANPLKPSSSIETITKVESPLGLASANCPWRHIMLLEAGGCS